MHIVECIIWFLAGWGVASIIWYVAYKYRMNKVRSGRKVSSYTDSNGVTHRSENGKVVAHYMRVKSPCPCGSLCQCHCHGDERSTYAD